MALPDSAWKFWFRARHDQLCLAAGEEFENYVSKVLSHLHKDYVNPEAMGSLGDGGCDGIAENGSILYACYGQRAVTNLDQKTKKKLEDDFARAYAFWPEFRVWRFVTNASFGPASTDSLLKLRKKHGPDSKRPIALELWKAPDDLWWEAVSKLAWDQLDEIIPGSPHAQNVELDDLVELIEMLEGVEGGDVDHLLEDIRPVSSTKMDFNRLPRTTRTEFDEGRLLSLRIDKWFAGQPDPGLRDAKARRFRQIYEEARRVTSDVREIVRRVYVALGGPDFDMWTKRANAVYAVTVYFFDSCDIFEEPPADFSIGETGDVASD
ncbi:ABC-three component system protein [Peptidiphaga gingivicola]|nr:ABC-three component system protein [Peptidiphaga gingivicola]